MYVLVDGDLKMGRGKVAAQVGHAVQAMTERHVGSRAWRTYREAGSRKIILRGTSEQLATLARSPQAVVVRDAGHTQVPAGSVTAVAVMDATDDAWLVGLKLL